MYRLNSMRWLVLVSGLWLMLGMARVDAATTVYVATNGTHVAPYDTWATAATNIQAAVDAVADGGTVWVSNGVYATGGRVVYGSMTNRVAIDRPMTVQSVNGPGITFIVGQGVGSGSTNCGDGAIRCAYVTNGAVLAGFTLTNGFTRVSGDATKERCGGGAWCETMATVTNCMITRNSASSGGGASGGTLNNCTLSGNSASSGGGVRQGTLNNCTLNGNSASVYGGGAYQGTLNNCTLSGNSASYSGGGANGGTLYNCTLSGNSASSGGGVRQCTLNNCTLSGNSASSFGGGASDGTLNNCIVYYNRAGQGANCYNSTVNYSCTTPAMAGTGNNSADPLLADFAHLAAGSPCIGAGSSAYSGGTDIDGQAWQNPPSMGCDEYVAGTATGGLNVAIQTPYTNAAAGFAIDFTGVIGGHASDSVWTFGDGTVISNRPYTSHAWAAAGSYPVVLSAYNDTLPGGVSATVTVQIAAQPVYYVVKGNAGAASPYATWATAASNIQVAIDATVLPGALVLVSNGVYDAGGVAVYGSMTNRVALTKAITVQSVNGPASTFIVGQGVGSGGTNCGDGAVRCAYVTNGAVLAGFAFTNGFTRNSGDSIKELSGGGVWCEPMATVTNCMITRNSASSQGGGASYGTLNNCTLSGNSASSGGGASDGTLNNCTLSSNSASSQGGGASGGTLNNCTLSGNSASSGGGAYDGTLNNCTLSGNSASSGGGGASGGMLNNCIVYWNTAGTSNNCYSSVLTYCCTLGANGAGCITNDPQFVSTNAGNYRLMAGSPCTDAGTNQEWMTGAADLDGKPRILYGVVDMGAYEWNSGLSRTITSSAGPNGSIVPSGAVAVADGGVTNFTMTPTDGYRIADVVVDGFSVGITNAYTFANVTNDRTVSVSFEPLPRHGLTVVSLYGGSSPGTQSADERTFLSQWITNSPVTSGSTQYVCTGAAVVSNSFSLVSPTNVTLTITNHATLTWLWTTNYWLATATNGPGTVSAASGWTALGSNVTLTAVPLAASWFMNWSGNTSGCSIAGTQIVGPMTASRSIQANFKANAAPTAATGGPYAVTVGQNLALNGSGSSDADAAYGDSLVAYEWDVDNDGQFNDATGASPTLTWAQLQGLGLGTPGLYTVRLRVTDTLGAVGVGSTSLTVAALASGITVLGVNGAAVANGEAASVPKGTDFGTRTVGASVTNTFAITNSGTATLSISGVTTSGTGAAHFRVLGMPATVVAGAASNFWIVFSPGVTGVQAAAVSIANNSTNTPYVVNVSGTGRLVTGGIDPTNKYAWSSHTGWQNWAPTHGGVTVVNAGANGYLTGFVWTENAGWIKLGAGPGPYANTGAGDWGVNMDASGNLSGYAWSSHVGWINFHPTHGQVTVDTGTGRFDGFAWGENIGWIHFKNASPAYNVRTTVFDLLSSVWSGSGFTFK